MSKTEASLWKAWPILLNADKVSSSMFEGPSQGNIDNQIGQWQAVSNSEEIAAISRALQYEP